MTKTHQPTLTLSSAAQILQALEHPGSTSSADQQHRPPATIYLTGTSDSFDSLSNVAENAGSDSEPDEQAPPAPLAAPRATRPAEVPPLVLPAPRVFPQTPAAYSIPHLPSGIPQGLSLKHEPSGIYAVKLAAGPTAQTHPLPPRKEISPPPQTTSPPTTCCLIL